MFSQLSIEKLKLTVHIGWQDAERSHRQDLELDLWIRFPKPPGACGSDLLDETACYGGLADSIRELCESRQFRLLERLATQILEHTRARLPAEVKACVRLKKISPPVAGLEGGASFILGDFEP